jgi:hypothetical protein
LPKTGFLKIGGRSDVTVRVTGFFVADKVRVLLFGERLLRLHCCGAELKF